MYNLPRLVCLLRAGPGSVASVILVESNRVSNTRPFITWNNFIVKHIIDNNGTSGLVVVQTVDVAGGCLVCGHVLPMSRLVWGLSYRRMVRNVSRPQLGTGSPCSNETPE